MNTNESSEITERPVSHSNVPTYISRTSRLAYVRPIYKFTVFVLVTTSLTIWGFGQFRNFWVLGVGLLLLTVRGLLFANTVFILRSKKLFVNSDGVWQEEGYVPWQRGIYGVSWRDFGSVSFSDDGIRNWIFKTGNLFVSHRFKNDYYPIRFLNVDRPVECARAINQAFRKYYGDRHDIL